MAAATRVADKLEQQYGVRFCWEGSRARINGPGVKGSCTVVASDVEVRLSLGLLVAPFASRVKAEIERYFDQLNSS